MLERHIHNAIADLLRVVLPPAASIWWHTANERKCTPRQGALNKRRGVRAGVADFLIIAQHTRYNNSVVLFLEVKGPKGRLSEAQIAFQDRVRELGCFYKVVRSVEEAQEALDHYGITRKAAA